MYRCVFYWFFSSEAPEYRDHGVVTNSKASHQDHRALTGRCPSCCNTAVFPQSKLFPQRAVFDTGWYLGVSFPGKGETMFNEEEEGPLRRLGIQKNGWKLCTLLLPLTSSIPEAGKPAAWGNQVTQCWPVRHKWELLVWLPGKTIAS